jgi:plasmid maintenance system antidote protein VapI
MVMRIGEMCGNGPDIWLKMQGRYDLRIAERDLGDALDKIPGSKAASVG